MTPEERARKAYEDGLCACYDEPCEIHGRIASAIRAAVEEERRRNTCGHPVACVVQASGGTAHCSACEMQARAVESEREAISRWMNERADQIVRQAVGFDTGDMHRAGLLRELAAGIRARGGKG